MDSTYVRARDISKQIVRLQKLQADGVQTLDGVDIRRLIAVERGLLEETGMGPLIGR